MSSKTLEPMQAAELFKKFDRAFGLQKTSTHWGVQDMALVRADWDEELCKFSSVTASRALGAMKQQGMAWPPSLGEFVQLCRQFIRPEHQLLLPNDVVPTTDEQARANLRKIRAMVNGTVKRMPVA